MPNRPARSTSFEVNGTTHVGNVRRHNEDAVGINGSVLTGSGSFSQTLSEPENTLPIHCIVADGLGGHDHGEIASELTVRSLSKYGSEELSSADFIESVHQVNNEIHEKNREMNLLLPMGTTVCGVRLFKTTVTWFNAGDSRIYRYRRSTLSQLSIDDIPPEEKSQRTTSQVTQCLGGNFRETPIEVHHENIELEDGDIFLLASDGLTDEVPDEMIARSLSKYSGEQTTQELLTLALDSGGSDNISIIVIGYKLAVDLMATCSISKEKNE